MVSLSRCLGPLALLLAGVDGVRKRHKHSGSASSTVKFVAGVPILNYPMAYGGQGSFEELEADKEEEWVVVVKPGTTDAQVQRMCETSRRGCNLIGSVEGGVPFVELRGTERDLEAVLKVADGAVKFVEPDQEVFMIPELQADDLEGATWGLNRIGADQRAKSGAGATVFVLDTGVRVTHQEFGGQGGRASPALDVSSGHPVECNGNLDCAGDREGHGTHCAGTAAGKSYGVAPAAVVKSIKVLSDSGSGAWSWVYSALDWVARNQDRPAVASMSLGGAGAQSGMQVAIDAAVNSGVTVVVAAGNSKSDACGYSPAFVPSAITVGSTTSLDERSSFSSYGACVNIWAPGSIILSASHASDIDSITLSGTSMATPHVAGAAALILEADPSKKSSAVLQELLDNAVTNAITGLWTTDTNALLYVAEGGPPPTPEPAPTPAPTPGCPAVFSTGPDSNGDCKCISGLWCYEDGAARCTTSRGWTSSTKFRMSCSDCRCL